MQEFLSETEIGDSPRIKAHWPSRRGALNEVRPCALRTPRSSLDAGFGASRSAPLQRDADVPGYAPGEIGDLVSDLVAAWFELPLPERIHLLGQAGERVLPAGLQVVVDGAPVVGAHHIGEAKHLHLG